MAKDFAGIFQYIGISLLAYHLARNTMGTLKILGIEEAAAHHKEKVAFQHPQLSLKTRQAIEMPYVDNEHFDYGK